MNGKVRIGVIGLGIMGEQYTRIYSKHPLGEVTALATRNEAKLRDFGDRYGVAARYTDYRQMLAEAPLDAVCLATPDFAHFEPVKAAICSMAA